MTPDSSDAETPAKDLARTSAPAAAARVVGVFDSGFGGLTVLRELLPLMERTHYLYLGDTARLPYGAKSQATVARYAIESARFLVERGAGQLVIACNTATALALDDIRAAVDVPVLGVIAPGAEAAREALPPAERRVLVLATTATVESHAYRAACAHLGLQAEEKACPLLVPLVEEGWTDHPVTRDVLRIYLAEALEAGAPDAVLLGCTHYPLIAPLIREVLAELGSEAPVIDSAHATAHALRAHLLPDQLAPPGGAHGVTFSCFVTDSVEKFRRLGSHFLGRTIPAVQLLDLGG